VSKGKKNENPPSLGGSLERGKNGNPSIQRQGKRKKKSSRSFPGRGQSPLKEKKKKKTAAQILLSHKRGRRGKSKKLSSGFVEKKSGQYQ